MAGSPASEHAGPRLRVLKLLGVQRELYDMPRDRARFKRYLELMIGASGDDIELPLAVLNPLGREHVAETLDRLIELGAEAVAAAAATEASARLSGLTADYEVALVLADDRRGGWTDRHLTDMKARFAPRAELRRGWIVVTLWTGDEPTAQAVRSATLAAIYRRFFYLRQGAPKTLAEMMRQEGLAARFAGMIEPALEPDDLEYTREVLASHRESTSFPVCFACLYGDEAATSKGYRPLGLSRDAGWALALSEAGEAGESPEAVLRDRPGPRTGESAT